MTGKKVIVSLGGGLGNQLFQLAAGLNFAGKFGEVELEWMLFSPRLNRSGLPELASFVLPPNVSIQKRRLTSSFLRKAKGYELRMGIKRRGLERFRIWRALIHFAANTVSIIHLQVPSHSVIAEGLGYFETKTYLKKSVLTGYFQSYVWADNELVKPKLLALTCEVKSSHLLEIETIARQENPIIIHVRLGDYKQENFFGVLSAAYYQKALSEMLKHTTSRNVWVFSDEIETAKGYFVNMKHLHFKFIDNVDNSTSLTFQAMRLGSNYIIGNSTFSWWAAYLSKCSNAQVIAPKPWFQGMDEPKELIPPSWSRMDAWWT